MKTPISRPRPSLLGRLFSWWPKAKGSQSQLEISTGARGLDHLPPDEQLRRLYQLRDDSIITEEEYTAKKREILERM